MQTWTDLGVESNYYVRVLDTSGTALAIIDDYSQVEYVRKLNAQGYFELQASTDVVDPDWFDLDYLVEIWRRPPGGDWGIDFTGFVRYQQFGIDPQDTEWLTIRGPSLESLLYRRVVLPTSGQAFLTYTNEQFTDIMRGLVRTQCTAPADSARVLPGLIVEANTNEGVSLTLNYRYVSLYESLRELSELGADFVIAHTSGATFEFQVHYPRLGSDRTVGNTDGNPPVIFSLEMATMEQPKVELDRLEERTVVYVGGEGIGAARTISERYSIWSDDADARNDSPWNRIEEFLEARQETSIGALAAYGDAYLATNRRATRFECEAILSPLNLYGVHWFLGDLTTGRYRGVDYSMQINEARVLLRDGEQIFPTFEVEP